MSYRLALTERATADIVNAFKWCESQQNGLGRRFVAAVDTAFTLLESMPSKGPAVHGDVRRVVLRQFPYVLYYRLSTDRIEVLACLHQHRKPFAWRSRRP